MRLGLFTPKRPLPRLPQDLAVAHGPAERTQDTVGAPDHHHVTRGGVRDGNCPARPRAPGLHGPAARTQSNPDGRRCLSTAAAMRRRGTTQHRAAGTGGLRHGGGAPSEGLRQRLPARRALRRLANHARRRQAQVPHRQAPGVRARHRGEAGDGHAARRVPAAEGGRGSLTADAAGVEQPELVCEFVVFPRNQRETAMITSE